MIEHKIRTEPTYTIFKNVDENYAIGYFGNVIGGIYYRDASDEFYKFNVWLSSFCKRHRLNIVKMEEFVHDIEVEHMKNFISAWGLEVGRIKYLYLVAKSLELFALHKIKIDGRWQRYNEVNVINEINWWADILLNDLKDN